MDLSTLLVSINVGSMFFSTVILLLFSVKGVTARNSLLFGLLSIFTLTHGLWHLSLYIGERAVAEYLGPASAVLLLVFVIMYMRREAYLAA